MEPQNLTASIPQETQTQAPDLAALVAPPGQAPVETPQGVPQAPQQEQLDPRLVLAAQAYEAERQRAEALQAQQDQYEAQRLTDWASSLDESQKPFGEWAVQAIQTVKEKDRQIAQLTAQVAQMQQQFLPYVKNDAFSQLSQQHGIPRQVLEQYAQSPQEARAIAQALAAYQKQMQFQQRQTAQVDQAATPSMAASSVSSKEAIAEKYKGSGRLEDKLRAFAQAGLK